MWDRGSIPLASIVALPQTNERVRREKMHETQVFDIAVRDHALPDTIEELVPLSFIGQKAVTFYREKVKLMNQLDIAEEQKQATLKDGQDAGELLLNIEKRIGELLPSAEETKRMNRTNADDTGRFAASLPAGFGDTPGKRAHVAHSARTIANNPEAVAEVIQEAKDNDDIPTKTAVLNKVKAKKAEDKLKAFRESHRTEDKPDLSEYLEKSIEHIVQVNTLVKKFYEYPDQVDGDRMRYFVEQVKRLVSIISKETEGAEWKQLN